MNPHSTVRTSASEFLESMDLSSRQKGQY
jgi:hypothetical protein